jgi:hypothetical protein
VTTQERTLPIHLLFLPLFGNLTEGLTESASMIEFGLQGSIKAEPLWLVPLSERDMPGNEWKFVIHLFY